MLTILLIFFLLIAYLAWRLIAPFSFSARKKIKLRLLIVVLALSFFFPFLIRRFEMNLSMEQFISQGVFILIGYFSFVLSLLFLKDLFHGVLFVANRFRKQQIFRLNHQKINIGILIISLLLSGLGYYNAVKIPDIKNVTIKSEVDLKGLRIVQLSDLHITYPFQKKWLSKVIEKVNDLNADVIVITGDLVDQEPEKIGKELGLLKKLRSKYGIYVVTGNHEYHYDANQWIEVFRQTGLHVLLNEHRIIEHKNCRIVLAGVPDYNTRSNTLHESKPGKAIEGVSSSDYKILLAHTPQSIHEAAEADYDLQLSGHTHGGQFFPWNLLIGLGEPFMHGLYTQQNTQLYVSRGTGYWGIPLRLGAPSEITLLQFKK